MTRTQALVLAEVASGQVARRCHASRVRLAPLFVDQQSEAPWDRLSCSDRALMTAVAREVAGPILAALVELTAAVECRGATEMAAGTQVARTVLRGLGL